MLLWVAFAVLTAVVVALLLRPLLAGETDDGAAESAQSAPLSSGAVYRDQLTEIEAERARGLIADAEAEAARVEIARRLLATADARAAATPSVRAAAPVRFVAMFVAASLPVLAILSYITLGSPAAPGRPFAERTSPPGAAPGITKLIAQVEDRLRKHPEDGRGWDVIAPVYLRLGRYSEASDAFQRSIRLLGENPARLAGLAESQVLASDGVVTEVARTAYERLRVLEPDQLEPRFWLAVAAEQDGRFEEAAKAYDMLLAEGEPAAPWRPAVTARWRVARSKLGLPTDAPPSGGAKPASTVPPADPSASDASSGKAPALPKETVDAVQSMTPDARRQMIEDMVAGLDKRLSEDGRDLEGWQRLIRAYAVLGRRDDALAALARARVALANETQSLEALAALARTLGLAS
jgi:cytochrome c-type biogenesis protein CcmH